MRLASLLSASLFVVLSAAGCGGASSANSDDAAVAGPDMATDAGGGSDAGGASCTGATCTLPNASAACVNGVCGVVSCNAGWGDCDKSAANGCEVRLATDNGSCGMCGNACGSRRLCSSGTCRLKDGETCAADGECWNGSCLGKLCQLPSCVKLPSACGPTADGNCCESPVVAGGTFKRSYDGVTYNDASNPATVSDFKLDKYLITVGRFRNFVAAGQGIQAKPPAQGAGARANLPGSGWDPSWNANLPADAGALVSALKCDNAQATWTDAAGANDTRPMNCLSWYLAMAFCAWDAGYLPTEAEYNYAMAGGAEQRVYPWSSPATDTTIDSTYASYMCAGGCSSVADFTFVGSKPKGNGKWGQADLSGNVWEWMLDGSANSYANPCVDCANVDVASPFRVVRGGTFAYDESALRSGFHFRFPPAYHSDLVGVRCARRP